MKTWIMKNAIIFTIIDNSKMLRIFFVKNFIRFFEFVRHKKNDKSFILINDDDDDDWTDFELLINDIETWSATKFKKNKKIKNVQNIKDVKNIKEIEKTSKKNSQKDENVKTIKVRQDMTNFEIIELNIL